MKTVTLLFFLLCGCTATGQQFAVPEPSNDAAVVVYRPSGLQLHPYDIEINGNKVCDLKRDGYFMRHYKPGIITITASVWDMPGTSRLQITVEKKHIYYVRIDKSDKQYAKLALGFVGSLVAEGVSSTDGPYDITLVPETTAKRELTELSEDCAQ